MSVEMALKVISSRTMRWSSPLKFNDPFDHQIGFSFDLNAEQFGQKLFEKMEQIVFGEEPEFKEPTLLSTLVMRLRSIKDRIPKDEFTNNLTAATSEVAGNLDNHLNVLTGMIIEQSLHSRVLCVSECHDNIVMWSHYGDQHQGVVLQLQCIDEIDNTLLVARKVKYSHELPRFPSLDSYIQHLFGEEPMDIAELSKKVIFTKHKDWSYEKEWRVHIPLLDEPPGDGYSTFIENPRVFGAVYLGCRISDDDAGQIIEAVREYIPAAIIYRGRKSTQSFDLSFVEI